jgi:hypothetical protein
LEAVPATVVFPVTVRVIFVPIFRLPDVIVRLRIVVLAVITGAILGATTVLINTLSEAVGPPAGAAGDQLEPVAHAFVVPTQT